MTDPKASWLLYYSSDLILWSVEVPLAMRFISGSVTWDNGTWLDTTVCNSGAISLPFFFFFKDAAKLCVSFLEVVPRRNCHPVCYLLEGQDCPERAPSRHFVFLAQPEMHEPLEVTVAPFHVPAKHHAALFRLAYAKGESNIRWAAWKFPSADIFLSQLMTSLVD